MKKGFKIAIASVTALVLAGGLATSIVLNISMNKDINKLEKIATQLNNKLDEKTTTDKDYSEDEDFEEEDYDDEWEDEDFRGEVDYEEGDYYHENGELIVIGDEYKIRDFDYIAQAYLTNDMTLLKSDADKETYELAVEVLEEIIKDGMTDYEKELAIHDWLCKNIGFDEESLSAIGSAMTFSDTPYGALKYHMAVCVGYATTFRLLTTMAGMECDIIHDTDYSHTWNIIKLEDEYYLVDVYSDAVDDKTCLHTYFNCNEENWSYSYDVERYPSAEGTKFSYASMNAVELKTADEIIDKCADIYDEGGELYFRMTGDLTNADVFYILEGVAERTNMRDEAYAETGISDIESENPVFSISIMIWGDEFFDDDVIDFEDMTIDTDETDEKLNDLFGTVDYDEEFYDEEFDEFYTDF